MRDLVTFSAEVVTNFDEKNSKIGLAKKNHYEFLYVEDSIMQLIKVLIV